MKVEQKKKELKSYQKTKIKYFIIRLCVFICICAVLLCSLFFSDFFEKHINHMYFNFNNEISSSLCKVHFINVGQGDCTFIQLPDGKNLMIDTGPENSIDNVESYLKILGLNKRDKIDYLILTHTDSDHIGNASKIINNYKIENIYIPKVYSNYEIENNLNFYDYNLVTSKLWYQTSKTIHENVNNINYSFKDMVIESVEYNYSLIFYTPLNDKESNSNDYSPIIMLNYNHNKFMFVGDVSSKAESEFLEYYNDILNLGYFDVDVLKVSHHGSKNSTTQQFLNVVKPEKAIISCGKENNYNHPNNETINNLVNYGCDVFRTDVSGSIVCSAKNDKIFIQTNYESFRTIYFEWWNFVVSLIIIAFYITFFVKFNNKKEDENFNKNPNKKTKKSS